MKDYRQLRTTTHVIVVSNVQDEITGYQIVQEDVNVQKELTVISASTFIISYFMKRMQTLLQPLEPLQQIKQQYFLLCEQMPLAKMV